MSWKHEEGCKGIPGWTEGCGAAGRLGWGLLAGVGLERWSSPPRIWSFHLVYLVGGTYYWVRLNLIPRRKGDRVGIQGTPAPSHLPAFSQGAANRKEIAAVSVDLIQRTDVCFV